MFLLAVKHYYFSRKQAAARDEEEAADTLITHGANRVSE
jgi:hypothetical protein